MRCYVITDLTYWPGQYSNIPVKFAQNYEKMWIQLFQQFIGIYNKSNVRACLTKNEMWNMKHYVPKVHDLI